MTIYLSTSKVSTDREIGAPGHGRDCLDGQNKRDKRYLREQMKRLSKFLTTTCEVFGMLHSVSNKLTVSF